MADPASTSPLSTGEQNSPEVERMLADRIGNLSSRSRRGLHNAGVAIGQNRPQEAERLLEGVRSSCGTLPEFLRLLGIVRHLQDRHAEAIALLREAAAAAPHDGLIQNNLGSALRGAGDLVAAEAVFRRACELAPGLAASWFNLARACLAQGNVDAAEEAFARAVATEPGHLRARVGRAEALVSLGRIDEAIGAFRSAIDAHPGSVAAWSGLAGIKTRRLGAEDADALGKLIDSGQLDAEQIATAGFALARALEDQDRYPEAFTVLTSANAAKRRLVDWDAAGFSKTIDATIAAFDRPPPASAPADLGEGVIFITAMPRSGTTLTEQILSAHPDVEGAGELSVLTDVLTAECHRRKTDIAEWMHVARAADWTRLGREYLDRTERYHRHTKYFTDKGLASWRVAGAALAMLPGARFINCRRDPVETCLANFRQLFGKGHTYTYDLAEVAAYWKDYDRLIRFWQARYPHRMLDVRLEQLVEDPETEVRRLLDYCGLPFDPACLRYWDNPRAVRTASAAQIRQPPTRSPGRAERYGTELMAPLRWALGIENVIDI